MSFSHEIKDLGVRFIEVDEDSSDQRLDNFLLRMIKGVPRSYVYRILRSGEVRVNKGRKKPEYRLKTGDSVRIPPTKAVKSSKLVKSGNLTWLLDAILYEDDFILLLNKPSGLAVHGGSGLNFGIIEAMRQLRPELRTLELVHRLDRDTSGVLLLAKKRSALRHLHESMRNNGFKKHYLALLCGVMEHKVQDIQNSLEKTDRAGERIVKISDTGKPARSYFTRKRVYPASAGFDGGATLVDIRLFSGRTHQARVHATSLGQPIAGDSKYGDKHCNSQLKEMGLTRLFLHAAWLQFPHPDTNSQVRFDAPLPDNLELVLSNLKQ